MTTRKLTRRVATLALAATLFISLATASAAAVPGPDDIDYPDELVECPEVTDAANPLSENNSTEYLDCKEKRTSQWVERTVKQDVEHSLERFQSLEERVNQVRKNLESQAERVML